MAFESTENNQETQTSLLKDKDDDKEKTEETKDEKEKEEDYEGVPMDRGWAWMICACVFINMSIVIGFNRTVSVLFVDIKEKFEERATVITLMFTVHALFGSITSIIASNIIMRRFSVRTISVAAAILNSVTSVLLAVAPNITIFLLLFVLKGSAFGALLVCPMSLIGFYFKKRRSLASSLAFAGFPIAFVVFPLITELLRGQYGLQGTFLVIAAIELHLVASSMFFRPVEEYKQSYARRKKKEVEQQEELTPIHKGPGNEVARHRFTNTSTSNHYTGNLKQVNSHLNNSEQGLKLVTPTSAQYTDSYNVHSGENRNLLQMPNGASGDDHITDDTFRQRSHSDSRQMKRLDPYTSSSRNGTHITPDLAPATFSSLKNLETVSKIDFSHHSGRVAREKSGSHRYISQLSIISVEELPCILFKEDAPVEDSNNSEDGKKSKCFLKGIIDFSLFKIWLFRMMAVFVPLGSFSNYLLIYMPTIAVTSGIDKSEASMLISMAGAMDLVTRIFTGFLGDFEFVSKSKMVAFSTFVLSIVCQCSRLFTTYTLFVVFAVLVGIFGGFRQNFFNVMLIDYVGVENIAKAHGFCITLATLVMSINHPVLGAMLDSSGSFVIPLHYIGVMIFLATVVLLCEPLFRKQDEKRLAKIKMDNVQNDEDVEASGLQCEPVKDKTKS